MLIDTHCHLNFPDFEKDLDQVLTNALESGVEKIVCVGSNIEDSKKAIAVARKFPGSVFAAVGIHPQKTDPGNQDSLEKQLKQLEELVRERGVVAVGECGLDYTPAPPGEMDRSHEEQVFLFERQIELARKLGLPIIVHSRKAFEDTIGVLRSAQNDNKSLGGVFHCYSGGKSDIQKVVDLGFYFGIDGNITYDPGLQNVVSKIPVDHLLFETDAPFLAPVPFRGLRNTPRNVKIICEFTASLLSVSLDKLAFLTAENAHKLFFYPLTQKTLSN